MTFSTGGSGSAVLEILVSTFSKIEEVLCEVHVFILSEFARGTSNDSAEIPIYSG